MILRVERKNPRPQEQRTCNPWESPCGDRCSRNGGPRLVDLDHVYVQCACVAIHECALGKTVEEHRAEGAATNVGEPDEAAMPHQITPLHKAHTYKQPSFCHRVHTLFILPPPLLSPQFPSHSSLLRPCRSRSMGLLDEFRSGNFSLYGQWQVQSSYIVPARLFFDRGYSRSIHDLFTVTSLVWYLPPVAMLF